MTVNTLVEEALRHIPMVVKTIAKRGTVPANWGTVYVLGKVKALLSNMEQEDAIQEVLLRVLEYYDPDSVYHRMRLRKLGETEAGNSPILGVKALNRALNHITYNFPNEVPTDPAKLPKSNLKKA